MTALHDVLDDVLHQLTIHLVALLTTSVLDILLDGPDSPQGYVGMLYFVKFDAERLALHEFAESLLRGLHHVFEVVLLTDSQCQARQRDKRIAGTSLEPRITGQQVTVVSIVKMFW